MPLAAETRPDRPALTGEEFRRAAAAAAAVLAASRRRNRHPRRLPQITGVRVPPPSGQAPGDPAFPADPAARRGRPPAKKEPESR